ncbi:MAG TPA: ABC transporter permease [Candidatus Saccharimonadales bacterium]|nr:ABC transporter permease [Candidatus Saccharimonadales bacterium]
MKLHDIFLTASANMFRSKLRTFLTIIAIFIGAFTLTLTNGIGTGIADYIDRQVGSLGQKDLVTITVKSTANPQDDKPQKYDPNKTTSSGRGVGAEVSSVLTQKDIDTLKAESDLTDVQPSFSVSPDYISGENGEKFKVSSSSIGGLATLDLAAGAQLNKDGNQIIIPENYVSSLGYSNDSDAVNKKVTIAISDAFGKQQTIEATIVGVQRPGIISSSGAALNQTLTNTLYGIQTSGLPDNAKNKFIAATGRITGDLTSQHIQDVKNKLSEKGYAIQTVDDQLGTFKTVINAITWVLNGFAIIALLAASFGIVNTLLMSVQERTKEIGLMKAMGMRSSRIFLLFSTEAVLIGFWGSLIGVVAAMLIGQLINGSLANSLLKDLPGFSLLVFTPMAVLGVMLLIMVIAFIAGTLPARQAAKQHPIDALRYE